MLFTFTPLFSGSSGNSLLIRTDSQLFLVDAGVSAKRISEALQQLDISPEMLDGIVITHEHSDHISGVSVLARKYSLNVFASAGTWRGMPRVACELPERSRYVVDGDFYIGNVSLSPFAIPHDANEPMGYCVYYGGRKLVIATDIGHVTKRLGAMFSGADLMYIESNHDPDMLMKNPHYSLTLKNRILGAHGHLSNASCGDTLVKLYETGVRNAVLAHLSRENNTPELALETVQRCLLDAGKDTALHIAWRDRVSETFELL